MSGEISHKVFFLILIVFLKTSSLTSTSGDSSGRQDDKLLNPERNWIEEYTKLAKKQEIRHKELLKDYAKCLKVRNPFLNPGQIIEEISSLKDDSLNNVNPTTDFYLMFPTAKDSNSILSAEDAEDLKWLKSYYRTFKLQQLETRRLFEKYGRFFYLRHLRPERDVAHEIKEETRAANSSTKSHNEALIDSSSDATPTGNISSVAPTTENPDSILPDRNSSEDEHNISLNIFFVLWVILLGILVVHILIIFDYHCLPESIAVIFLGFTLGFLIMINPEHISSWRRGDVFSPTGFFLVLLPPIIFESGYNLHKGNFFQNIGSILVFAIVGTTISALVIGGGVYILGVAEVAYRLSFVESFGFGSLVSAVDPVATVAIFHALDVDPVLNMLVFGESILNDAIAIVLSTTILETNNPAMTSWEAFCTGISRFCLMFFASAGIGVAFALVSALILKNFGEFRKTPSLEFALMIVFTYFPYALAEGLHLSGIMAILFCGIVMSHYTHYNLSAVTQITMQQTMRTLAFIAETCIFAYLGLAIFSFKHHVEPALVIWSIILCLLGRAANIFPLAILVNRFREHKITGRMMFIMWFSGLRGAISYVLSLHLGFSDESRQVIITTTLIIVLFTTLVFGGSTLPLMKLLLRSRNDYKVTSNNISLSKTKKWGDAIDSENFSEWTEAEEWGTKLYRPRLKGFARLDAKYLRPFFTKRFTNQEIKECDNQMSSLTDNWVEMHRSLIRGGKSLSEIQKTKRTSNDSEAGPSRSTYKSRKSKTYKKIEGVSDDESETLYKKKGVSDDEHLVYKTRKSKSPYKKNGGSLNGTSSSEYKPRKVETFYKMKGVSNDEQKSEFMYKKKNVSYYEQSGFKNNIEDVNNKVKGASSSERESETLPKMKTSSDTGNEEESQTLLKTKKVSDEEQSSSPLAKSEKLANTLILSSSPFSVNVSDDEDFHFVSDSPTNAFS